MVQFACLYILVCSVAEGGGRYVEQSFNHIPLHFAWSNDDVRLSAVPHPPRSSTTDFVFIPASFLADIILSKQIFARDVSVTVGTKTV